MLSIAHVARGVQRGLATGLAVMALVGTACSDDKGTGPGTTVLVFIGTVNGDNGGLSGSITLNVDGSSVTGTFKVVAPAAATHALSGTYSTSTKALSASGDGYTFDGAYDGTSRLEGTMGGTASGTFVASKDNSSVAFCGTYTGSDDGVWSFTITGNSLAGSATSVNGSVTPLDGTVSGNTITVSLPGGGGTLATGTRNGDSANGTWDDGAGSSGTWTGSKCN